MPNTITAFERVRSDLFRYYDTPFRVRSEKIMAERRSLIDRDMGAWREPWIEVVRNYSLTGDGISSALRGVGASQDLLDFIACGLLEFDDIFTHQRDSLKSSLDKKNIVISAGTGSGKTESFLLPIFSSLVEESKNWSGSSPVGENWWENKDAGWAPQRVNETGKLSAVRALIIYPMNALVEDQLVRLRKATDSKSARLWFENNRNGHRFFFGRYTGRSPVSGDPSSKYKVADLRERHKVNSKRCY